MYKYIKHRKLSGALLLQQENLSNLNSFLQENFVQIEYIAETKDDTKIKFKDFQEIICYVNSSKRKIISLKISCSQPDRFLEIEFDDSIHLIIPRNIKYHLFYNDENWGFKFDDGLNENLSDFKPWYNVISYTNGINILGAILVFIISIVSIDSMLKMLGYKNYIKYVEKNDTSSSGLPSLFLSIIITSGSMWLYNKIRNYFFPTFFIATGKQLKVYEFRQKVLYFIFGILFLGVFINVISNKFFNF